MKPAAVLAIFLLSLSLIANLSALFRRVWTKESRARSFCLNACVAFFALVFAWMPLELFFGRFFIASDNFAFTLAAERWEDLHWKPRNEYKHRDEKRKEWRGKKVLFVVGDSFVAGHGIEDYKDRFSNVLADRLGPDWAVFNIAKNGWNTGDEIGALANALRDRLQATLEDLRGPAIWHRDHRRFGKAKARIAEIRAMLDSEGDPRAPDQREEWLDWADEAERSLAEAGAGSRK